MSTLSTLTAGDTGQFSERGKLFKVIWSSMNRSSYQVEYPHSGTRRWFNGDKEIYVAPPPFKMNFRTFMMKIEGKKIEVPASPRFKLPGEYSSSELAYALQKFVDYKYPDQSFDEAFTWDTALEDYDDDDWSLLFYDPGCLDRETYKLGCEILTDWAIQLGVLKERRRKKFLQEVFNAADQFFDDMEEEGTAW